jgi:hypothetical protein
MDAVTITQITPAELSLLIETSLRNILSLQHPVQRSENYIILCWLILSGFFILRIWL